MNKNKNIKTVRLCLDTSDLITAKSLATLNTFATLATASLLSSKLPVKAKTLQRYNFDKTLYKQRHLRLPADLCAMIPDTLKIQMGSEPDSLATISITVTDFVNLAVRHTLNNGLTVNLREYNKGGNDAK